MGTVAGAGLTELTKQPERRKKAIRVGAKSRMPEVSRKRVLGIESRQKRCQSRPRTRSKRFTFITQVDPSHGRDKTPEATDPEDLIPEAKTQSKESKYFSWSAQKVEERGVSKKVAEGGMGEEENFERATMQRHVTRE
jgi:hypothetical protein